MADTEIAVPVDEETRARIGTLSALYGLSEQELLRLLIERGIEEGVDKMLLEEEG